MSRACSRGENVEEVSFQEAFYRDAQRVRCARHIGRRISMAEREAAQDARLFDEVSSGIVEALDGRVETEYSFDVVNGRIVAEGGEPLYQILDRGYEAAVERAEEDAFYAQFGPQRALHERNELALFEDMIVAGKANTLIIFSPYSEEFDTSSYSRKLLFESGQRPDDKRAMLRVLYYDGSKATICTRSLDNAQFALLKSTAQDTLNYTYNAVTTTDMLGEPIVQNLESIEQVRGLLGSIVSTFDQKLGGDTSQGRSLEDAEDLEKLVSSRPDIVRQVISDTKVAAGDAACYDDFVQDYYTILYRYTALFHQLQRGYVVRGDVSDAAYGAGAASSMNGETYSFCGTVLQGNSSSSLAAQTGYESLTLLRRANCPECRSYVVLDAKLLRKGILQCNECNNTVDVCGDKAKAAKYRRVLEDKKKSEQTKTAKKKSVENKDKQKHAGVRKERVRQKVEAAQ